MRKRLERDHRMPDPPLDDDEGGERGEPAGNGAPDARDAPSRRSAPRSDRRPGSRGRRSPAARPARSSPRPTGCASPALAQRDPRDDRRDRQVDQEDRAPRDRLRRAIRRAAGPIARRDRRQRRPGADGASALARRERGAEDGEARRHEQRRADPLHGRARRGSARRPGASPQPSEAAAKRAAPSEKIRRRPNRSAERSADQDERGQEEARTPRRSTARSRPTCRGSLEDGQRDVDDRAVDEGHARAERSWPRGPSGRRRASKVRTWPGRMSASSHGPDDAIVMDRGLFHGDDGERPFSLLTCSIPLSGLRATDFS